MHQDGFFAFLINAYLHIGNVEEEKTHKMKAKANRAFMIFSTHPEINKTMEHF